MNTERSVTVHRVSVREIAEIVPLVDAYRQFYGKPSNPQKSHAFLLECFKYNQSIIFLANDSTGAAMGFVELYPSFSSASAAGYALSGKHKARNRGSNRHAHIMPEHLCC
jgi:hypothetical protein